MKDDYRKNIRKLNSQYNKNSQCKEIVNYNRTNTTRTLSVKRL